MTNNYWFDIVNWGPNKPTGPYRRQVKTWPIQKIPNLYEELKDLLMKVIVDELKILRELDKAHKKKLATIGTKPIRSQTSGKIYSGIHGLKGNPGSYNLPPLPKAPVPRNLNSHGYPYNISKLKKSLFEDYTEDKKKKRYLKALKDRLNGL